MKVDVNIIGFKYFDFVSDDGSPVQGTQIYYLDPIVNNGAGSIPRKKWIPKSVNVSKLKVGMNSFDITLDGRIVEVL